MTGDEEFRAGTFPLGFNVLAFWQWGASDLISNTFRGRFAEFLVAKALCLPDAARNEWDSVDLRDGDRTIEVKSSSYLQTWYQKALSKPSFRIGLTRAWDPVTGGMAVESRRQSDLYVFALLAHRDKATLNPLDVAQWEFDVLPTFVLNEQVPNQKQISLSTIRDKRNLGASHCAFSDLRQTVDREWMRVREWQLRNGVPTTTVDV